MGKTPHVSGAVVLRRGDYSTSMSKYCCAPRVGRRRKRPLLKEMGGIGKAEADAASAVRSWRFQLHPCHGRFDAVIQRRGIAANRSSA